MPDTITFKNAESLIKGDLTNAVVPEGHVKITLSTQGKISKAPAVCFARAMTAAEVLSLSMYIRDELQGPLIGILDNIIYKDNKRPVSSVANWTPEEVIEFTIKYYSNFFGDTIKDLDYFPDIEEINWLNDQKRFAEAKALETGEWSPRITLNLRDLKYTVLPKEVSRRIIVSHSEKHPDFKVGFRWPYYGDLLIVHDTLKKMEDQKNKLDMTVLITLLSNALLIETIQDTSVASQSPKEKLDIIMRDPKFSMALFERVSEEFNKVKFGVDEKITITSPITQKSITRRFQFRVVDVLSAMSLFRDNGYAVHYDPAYE